jgi:hypothetical protein
VRPRKQLAFDFSTPAGEVLVDERAVAPERSPASTPMRSAAGWNKAGRHKQDHCLSGGGNLCDVAPSRFERIEGDGYFTLDADWIIPALRRSIRVEGPILEPCAGRGHMVRELRSLGFVVHAADLYAYADTLVPDIKTGADVFGLKSLAGYRFVISNLPYREQDAILARLLPLAARDGAHVAILARSEWSSAVARRALIHENAQFAGEVRLTKRPEWVRPAIASPRHWFSWFVWSSEPRAPNQDPFLRFDGQGRPPSRHTVSHAPGQGELFR